MKKEFALETKMRKQLLLAEPYYEKHVCSNIKLDKNILLYCWVHNISYCRLYYMCICIC